MTKAWQELEARLSRVHDWWRLSRRLRLLVPEAADLDAIEDSLDVLDDEAEQLLAVLPRIPATTREGLIAKLTVAAVQISPDIDDDAHRLLASILQDCRTPSTQQVSLGVRLKYG